jgi:hypothetical protein
MCQTVSPPRLCMSWVGVGRRCRLSTQMATWEHARVILTERVQAARFSGRTGCSQAEGRGSQVRAACHSHYACAAIGPVLT